ncbi:MAG: type II and III secretion system protein family protein [Syntrophales bacterium]|nr:type II and III secretion system protein family protein [Syntrophales bacterium]
MIKGASLEWKVATARLLGGVLLGITLSLWAGGGPAQSANLLDRVRDQEIKQVLRIHVGSSKVIKTPFPVTRISVGNPEIADIVVISDRELYVNALSPGVTNITIWGHKRITSTSVHVELDVTLLKEMLHKILPKEKIGVETTGISVVLSGEVSSPSAMQTAISVAEAFLGIKSGGGGAVEDPKASKISMTTTTGGTGGGGGGTKAASGGQDKGRVINLMHVGGVQQVMLEVRVAEIQRDVARRMGVNISGISPRGNFGISQIGALTSVTDLQRLIGVIPTTIPPVGTLTTGWTQGIGTAVTALGGFTGGGVLWTMFFDILKTQGLGRILAEPNLVTTSGQKASFLAGGEFPVPVPQDFGNVTIQFKKFGVTLEFIPTVLDGGKLSIQVTPEVSELDFTTAPVVLASLVVPGLRMRTVTTHVELKDGQTFALAGLLSDNHRNTINKFPVLGDIPILGSLFRSTQYQKNETELVVLATPRLVKPMTTTAIRLPTDKYVEPTDYEAYLLGALEGRGKKNAATPAPAVKLPEGFGQKSLQ